MKKNLFFVLCAFMIIVLFSLEGCSKKKDEPTIVGTWRNDWVIGYEYDEFRFYDNGVGTFSKWKKDVEGQTGSRYNQVFSYTFDNNNLVLDYGFNYIISYHNVSLGDSLLILQYGNHDTYNYDLVSHYTQTDMIPDYSMGIIDSWDINDTEKSRRYIVTCRADGTYESLSTEYGYGSVNEYGTYKVDKSRVKFESTSEGSLLNGRIFMIAWTINSKWHDLDDDHVWHEYDGYIHLISENGVDIYGYHPSKSN